jgi:uncharacterized protein YhbP (UPF0306 family)
MSVDVESVIRKYIDATLHMSLATVSGNKPWVCELHFTYDDDLNIYFRSLKSRRHSQEIAANPHVAGNIVRQHAVGEFPHGIYFEGTAQLVDNQSKFAELYGYFKRRQTVTESIIDDAKREDGHQFYKITVDKWYAFGKFDGERAQKLELDWNGGKR